MHKQHQEPTNYDGEKHRERYQYVPNLHVDSPIGRNSNTTPSRTGTICLRRPFTNSRRRTVKMWYQSYRMKRNLGWVLLLPMLAITLAADAQDQR